MPQKLKFSDGLSYDVYQASLDSIDPREAGTGLGVCSHRDFFKWSLASSVSACLLCC